MNEPIVTLTLPALVMLGGLHAALITTLVTLVVTVRNLALRVSELRDQSEERCQERHGVAMSAIAVHESRLIALERRD